MIDPYIEYSNEQRRLTGFPLFLLGKNKKINLEICKSKIVDYVHIEEINLEERFPDRKIKLDKLFGENNTLKLKSSMDSCQLYGDILFGTISIDHPVYFSYESYLFAYLQKRYHNFHISYNEELNKNVLIIFSSRRRFGEAFSLLSGIFKRVGLKISPTKIQPKDLTNIMYEIEGNLVISTIDNYPSTKINAKTYYGDGFQNDDDYKKEIKKGKINQHMIRYHEVGDNDPYVVTISTDGLVSFYNNVSYVYLSNFVLKYVVNKLEQERIEEGYVKGFIVDEIYEDDVNG